MGAYHQDRPVLESDLAEPATPRWLAFAGPAVEAGVRAIFGFPLQVGAVRLGALNLYCDRPGPLTDEQHADALVMAVNEQLNHALNSRVVIEQAKGLIAERAGLDMEQAFSAFRGHARNQNLRLVDVCRDVIGGFLAATALDRRPPATPS